MEEPNGIFEVEAGEHHVQCQFRCWTVTTHIARTVVDTSVRVAHPTSDNLWELRAVFNVSVRGASIMVDPSADRGYEVGRADKDSIRFRLPEYSTANTKLEWLVPVAQEVRDKAVPAIQQYLNDHLKMVRDVVADALESAQNHCTKTATTLEYKAQALRLQAQQMWQVELQLRGLPVRLQGVADALDAFDAIKLS